MRVYCELVIFGCGVGRIGVVFGWVESVLIVLGFVGLGVEVMFGMKGVRYSWWGVGLFLWIRGSWGFKDEV